MKKIFPLIQITAMALLLSMNMFSCSKSEEKKSVESRTSPGAMKDEAKHSAGLEPLSVKKEKEKDGDTPKKGLPSHFITPLEQARERLLEYRINVTYESKDVIKSRQDLLAIISRYGFINSSRASTEGKYPYASVELSIRADTLFTALLDFEKIGAMLSETITVIDHTENMVLQEITVKRELLRTLRKSNAISASAPGAKTWVEQDASLSKTEDSLDRAELEKWKIKDRINWAKIHIYIKGPQMPDSIEVPNYGNALVGAVNGVLTFLYAVLYALPLIIIIGVMVWKRGAIKGLLRRNK